MRAFRSTSAIRKAHGSAAPTRIPTDCCDSIFRKAPISACIAPRRSPPWPTPSTPGPGRLSTGRHPQRRLTSGFHRLTKTVLRRPFESAQYAALAYRKLLAEHELAGSMGRRGNPYDNAKAESKAQFLVNRQQSACPAEGAHSRSAAPLTHENTAAQVRNEVLGDAVIGGESADT